MPEREDVLAKLEEALALHTHSLLTYLLQVSSPVSNGGEPGVLAVLRRLLEEQASDRAQIAGLIEDLGGALPEGGFDMEVAYYNYVGVDYLIDLVLQRLREHRAVCERLGHELRDEPRASDLVRAIADRRGKAEAAMQAALEAWRKAAAPPPTPAGAATAKPAAPAAAAAAKPAEPAAASAAKPAAKTIDPERLAALKAAAEKKRAALAAGAPSDADAAGKKEGA
jgi:pyruvate/2-oxoglutarate dehydrogenase complex dihydrolipoamide acyltransferase (E2) component